MVREAPREHSTLPAVALFSSLFLSMLSREDVCESGQCAGTARRLRQITTVVRLELNLTAVRTDAPPLFSHKRRF
jgi:hypothetical protein